jgi:hypothetical protein
MSDGSPAPRRAAEGILAARFARGELTEQEYRDRRSTCSSGRGPARTAERLLGRAGGRLEAQRRPAPQGGLRIGGDGSAC